MELYSTSSCFLAIAKPDSLTQESIGTSLVFLNPSCIKRCLQSSQPGTITGSPDCPSLSSSFWAMCWFHYTEHIVNNKWNMFWNCWGLLFTLGTVESQTWTSGLWPFTLMELLTGLSCILQFPWPPLRTEIRNRMQEKCAVSLKELLERIPRWISWKLSPGCKWNLIYNQKIHLWFYK